MSNGDDMLPRATTASIDRRVERLEISQAETNRAIDRLSLEQQHQSEVVNEKFKTLEAKSDTVSGKIDALQSFIQAEILKGAQQMADWRSMPAGRDISNEIRELKDALLTHEDESKVVWLERDKRLDKLETKMVVIGFALGVIVFVANLLGPKVIDIIVP